MRHKKKSDTIHAVKGAIAPLTPAQRDLVAIFVQYLRGLPAYVDENSKSWDSQEYEPVNQILLKHFRDQYPDWQPAKADNRYDINDLPDEGERYRYLMENAANAEHLVNVRRLKLLELARDKTWVFKFAARYEEDRAKLGLKPDHLLAFQQAITPIELAAEAAFIENHG